MKPWIRTIWRIQPLWLRRLELRVIAQFLASSLDPQRHLKTGNVVVAGFFGTATGLGEGARHLLREMRTGGIQVQQANVSRFAVMEDFAAGPLWPEQAPEGGVALFFINPDILNLIMRAIGAQRLQHRKIIGYWAWELEVIPYKWIRALRCVDEVWVPSHFIADALRKVSGAKPVHVVPLPIDVAAIPVTPRQDPLPQFAGRTMVLFAYDVRSTIARKNPEAVVEAFRRGTKNNPDAVLVIKVNNEATWPKARAHLEQAIGTMQNVHVIREVLTDQAVKDLVARADIVMSLHRSEGFGLLLAEAMAAAKPVIATGWSGNLDFMPVDCCIRVKYQLMPVCDPQNIYNSYQAVWAEPDIDDAAAALQRLLNYPDERQRLGMVARDFITGYFTPKNWLDMLPKSFWEMLVDKPRN